MPQRFLKSGERFLTVSNGSVLRNPTYQDSKPIIRAYGTGTITINGESIKVNSANEYTDLDSEMEDCYKGLTNANGNVTMITGGFPTLRSGSNTVSFSGFSAVKIKPRWWRL
jgi:phage-related protein